MADYILDLGQIESKKNSLTNLSNSANKVVSNFSSTKVNSNANGINNVTRKIKDNMTRLGRGYSNSNTWLTNYFNEITELESSLTKIESKTLKKPIEFNHTFEDIFSKVTIPRLKSPGIVESEYDTLASMQTGGHIEEGTFTASNGVKMKYYVYIPDFANGQTSGLPITVYLHGDSGYSHGVTSGSLPKLLTKEGLNVPGIVVMPQSNRDRWWESPRNMDTAAELVSYLADEYNCDRTRISACGHSNGGCGVHHMVAAHPDIFASYFSSAGATGKNKKFNAIGDNHVYSWGIHGTKDKNVDFSNKNGVGGKETYERLAANFPEGTEFTVLEGRDHFIQDEVWTTEYNYKGRMITPIKWLFTTKKWGA